MKINQDSLNGYFTAMNTMKEYVNILIDKKQKRLESCSYYLSIPGMDGPLKESHLTQYTQIKAELDLLLGTLSYILTIEKNYKTLLGKKDDKTN